MRKGWLIIPGVQDGDRTLEEQMRGVTEALAEAKGKRVLDLGCAEGLLGREFSRAGAEFVYGIDNVRDHLSVAMDQCKGLAMHFHCAGVQQYAEKEMASGRVEQFDIVMALGICHKLHDPEIGVRFAARSCKDLLLFRMHARSEAKDGWLRSKHRKHMVCNINEILPEEGFALEKILPGPREETTLWWRRNDGA